MSNLSLNQLRPEQVCERLGCGKTQLYKLVKNDPTFPKHRHLSPQPGAADLCSRLPQRFSFLNRVVSDG